MGQMDKKIQENYSKFLKNQFNQIYFNFGRKGVLKMIYLVRDVQKNLVISGQNVVKEEIDVVKRLKDGIVVLRARGNKVFWIA